MIGDGEVFFEGERMPAAHGLAKAGLKPVVLAAKEGLALINGTQVSTALALAGLFRAHRAAQSALITGALSTDAAMGSSAPFHPDIHTLRGHQRPDRHGGRPARAARRLGDPRQPSRRRRARAGPLLHPLPAAGRRRLPRPAAHRRRARWRSRPTPSPTIRWSCPTVRWCRAAISMPSRWPSPPTRSRIAVCEIGAIAQRRIALLVDPALSYRLAGLPGEEARAELRADDRRGHVARRLMSENKQMSHPASVDFDADFGQPGRPCLDGLPRRAPAAADDRKPVFGSSASRRSRRLRASTSARR